ncbi:hypothetical protein SAMN00017405_2036 [Desulfonispora thiosulfatigenes DSM 11270]|uniref:DUF2939 domain-containing protein n=1 Tax=Desulfonispora thiosulfatigenes DSM 11270 TaxID=656914 RepID=A0A1W1UJA2_DESTI|nr:hypothetical protein [Desulfonispora thiosulfatigenes]SMB81093.1 hypothetical protein SAMN00017405_2036 [Desulfonispora thiosulfatigenes DSM 11270]
MRATRTNKKSKKKLLIFMLIVVLITSLVVGYLYFLTTPQYSLLKITKAVEKHDLPTFEKYVDIDRVVTRLVDYVLEKEVKKISFGSVKLEKEIVKKIRPNIISYAKNEIRLFVAGGNIKNARASNAQIPVTSFAQDSGLEHLQYKGIEKIEKQGNTAKITLKIYHKRFKKELKPEIKMKKIEDYWRVYEINNIDSSLLIIEKLVSQKIKELHKPVKDWFSKVLPQKNIKIPKIPHLKEVKEIEKVVRDNWNYINRLLNQKLS